jgi:enterochelin esterase-like enzyme
VEAASEPAPSPVVEAASEPAGEVDAVRPTDGPASDAVEEHVAASTTVRVRALAVPPLIRSLARRGRRVLLSLAAASIVLLAAVATGWVDGADATLVGMGFDSDRAQLIVSLVVGGTVAAASYLSGGSRAVAVPLGFAAACLLFGQTFVTETHGALAASGAFGAFDPVGWTLTAAAFVTIATLTAWAAATVAVPIRREIALSAPAMIQALRQRPIDRPALVRPVAAALVVILLAVTLPVAGDLFNYGADSRLVRGGPPRQGLVPGDAAGPTAPLPSEPAASDPAPTATAAPTFSSASRSGSVSSPTPTPSGLPWKSTLPSGVSRIAYLGLAAPWLDAGTKTEEVTVYLPPGYDSGDARRYPTYYEAPFTFWLWNSGIHIQKMLDAMILQGVIPPSVFVFTNAGGDGPYADSECADSFDGQETMDHFLSVTVPTYIDKHYRTIAKPAARTTFGMSEGGFCAASLAVRHPDVFGAAIPFSGYFTAGAPTAASKLPFGNDPSLIARYSPNFLAPGKPASVRASLYFVLVAQPGQIFYGTQSATFATTLSDAGYRYDVIDSGQPHGWPQVRDELARALIMVATRQAESGVFD